jgi:hypothetical protein
MDTLWLLVCGMLCFMNLGFAAVEICLACKRTREHSVKKLIVFAVSSLGSCGGLGFMSATATGFIA